MGPRGGRSGAEGAVLPPESGNMLQSSVGTRLVGYGGSAGTGALGVAEVHEPCAYATRIPCDGQSGPHWVHPLHRAWHRGRALLMARDERPRKRSGNWDAQILLGLPQLCSSSAAGISLHVGMERKMKTFQKQSPEPGLGILEALEEPQAAGRDSARAARAFWAP